MVTVQEQICHLHKQPSLILTIRFQMTIKHIKVDFSSYEKSAHHSREEEPPSLYYFDSLGYLLA